MHRKTEIGSPDEDRHGLGMRADALGTLNLLTRVLFRSSYLIGKRHNLLTPEAPEPTTATLLPAKSDASSPSGH